MDAARDQLAGLVSHPHLLRDDLAVAPAIPIGHSRAAAQPLPHPGRRVDLPLLTPPQIAEEVVEVPALELAVRLLIDDHRSHRPAERRGRRVPRVRLVQPLDVVLDHLVGDRELERAEVLARVDVRREHALILLARVPSMPPARNGRRSDLRSAATPSACYSAGARRPGHATGPRVESTPPWRNVMSAPRFTTLTPETMTADQKRVADA